MTTRNRVLHINPVGGRSKRISRSSKKATPVSKPKNKSDLAALFRRERRVDDSWREILRVLPERAVYDQVED